MPGNGVPANTRWSWSGLVRALGEEAALLALSDMPGLGQYASSDSLGWAEPAGEPTSALDPAHDVCVGVVEPWDLDLDSLGLDWPERLDVSDHAYHSPFRGEGWTGRTRGVDKSTGQG